jgi:hypothetical protein
LPPALAWPRPHALRLAFCDVEYACRQQIPCHCRTFAFRVGHALYERTKYMRQMFVRGLALALQSPAETLPRDNYSRKREGNASSRGGLRRARSGESRHGRTRGVGRGVMATSIELFERASERPGGMCPTTTLPRGRCLESFSRVACGRERPDLVIEAGESWTSALAKESASIRYERIPALKYMCAHLCAR